MPSREPLASPGVDRESRFTPFFIPPLRATGIQGARMVPRGPLESLIRDETLAVEAYAHLIEVAPSHALAEAMRRLREGHRAARDALVARGSPRAADPRRLSSAGSPWDRLLRLGTDDAAVVPLVVAALRRAEEACLDTYAQTMVDGRISSADRVLLLSVLLPEQRTHEALLGAIDERTAAT
jgi:hypothetical protein